MIHHPMQAVVGTYHQRIHRLGILHIVLGCDLRIGVLVHFAPCNKGCQEQDQIC